MVIFYSSKWDDRRFVNFNRPGKNFVQSPENIIIELLSNILFMRNLFYLLLTVLLTACFRGPTLTCLPMASSPDAPGVALHGHTPSGPATELYASAEGAAAAGTVAVVPETSPETNSGFLPLAQVAPAGARPAIQPQQQLKNLRREIKETLRDVRVRKPAAGTEDDPVVPKRSGLALASLVLGIAGLAALVIGAAASAGGIGLFALIAGILALVFGAVAKGQIRNGQGNKADRGRATAGFILGLVNLGIFVLIFLLVIALVAAWRGPQ